MIDSVYHYVVMRPARNVRRKWDDSIEWTPAVNPAVRELLDHVARQLAEEFVRLTKADDPPRGDTDKGGKR